jgi:hypothetical protein
MKKIYTAIILAIFCFTNLNAQEKKDGPGQDMFEKIKAEKISFFTNKLDLNPSEAQAFWPVYNEFEKKRFEIQRQMHDFERMHSEDFAKLSDSEIEKMTNNYIGTFEKEAQLLKEYNKLFLKVLPKKKVLMMYQAENDFRSHLIREFKRDQKRD